MNILFTFSLTAQSLADEGNKWNVADYPTFSPITTSYSILIGKDTIANDLRYNKVFYSSDSLNLNWRYGNQLIRQDSTKKVFIKEFDNEEYLLYDFDLNLNDTFQIEGICTLVVTGIDSITLNNGEVRKRLQLNIKDYPDWGMQFWIEGIGSNYGMISHFGFCSFDYSDGFLCFYKDDELLFPEAPPSCFITPVNEVTDNKIKIFPNPVSHELTIESTDYNLTKYTLISLIGKTVQTGTLLGNKNRIYLGNLENGFYTILLGDEKEFRYSKRVLKIE